MWKLKAGENYARSDEVAVKDWKNIWMDCLKIPDDRFIMTIVAKLIFC